MFLDFMLQYKHTNETVQAIGAGLEPRDGDRILAIAGSGDQAFALLSFGAQVYAVDNVVEQVDYVKRRIDSLKKGDFSSFEDFKDYHPDDLNKAFFADGEVRERIRLNLPNLQISDAKCIFYGGLDFASFNKIYLSNAYAWSWTFPCPDKVMRHISRRVPVGSLVYGSATIEIPRWLFDLKVQKERTDVARSLEKGWRPMILKKRKSLSGYLYSLVTN